MHDSFGSIEDLDKILGDSPIAGREAMVPASDDVLPPARTMIARYRPNLSYRPDQAIQDLAKARYVDVIIYRIPPGTESDFSNALKAREFSRDSANVDRPDMAYEVISGAPSGTYMVLAPFATLRSLDDARPNTPVYAEADAANARKLAQNMQAM